MMNAPKFGSKKQPFPRRRPEITIAPSRAKPFVVNSGELPGWGLPLRLGATAWLSWYDPPDWRLTSVTYQHVVREAEVHGVGGFEIEMRDWEMPDAVWYPYFTHFARLTEDTQQWLATSHVRDGKRIVYTFLDDGFDADWGESDRRLEDTGRLADNGDGTHTLRQKGRKGQKSEGLVHDVFGAGVFRVSVGLRRFTCLRVIDVRTRARSKADLEREILSECYYTRSGQLILFRRYNGRHWATGGKSTYAGPPWDERFPDNIRLVINGATFVHWYDCLTDVSTGINETP